MKKLVKEDIMFVPIPGLKLRPLLESYICFSGGGLIEQELMKKDIIETLSKVDRENEMFQLMGAKLMQSLLRWPDKMNAERLFFAHCSLKDYGKLSEEKVQTAIMSDFGIMSLTMIFVEAWLYFLGESLTGNDDQERSEQPEDIPIETK